MRIEEVDVIVTSPCRDFVTLKLRTSLGALGLEDATLGHASGTTVEALFAGIL